MGGINTNPNDPKNAFATVFGVCADGTSWAIDFLVTVILVAVVMGFVDFLIPDAMQQAMMTLTNALIVTIGAITGVYVWRRAQADNLRRKADKAIK